MRRTILLAAAAAALALAGCEQASMENYAATEDAEAGAPVALEMIRPPEEGGRAAGAPARRKDGQGGCELLALNLWPNPAALSRGPLRRSLPRTRPGPTTLARPR